MKIVEEADFPAVPSQGYFVDYRHSADTPEAFEHFFCGPHEVCGAECPNCHKPLLHFLALDTQDTRLNLQNSLFQTLSLLYCWTCNIAQEPFFYHVLNDGSVELTQYGQGGVETDFPYENYPVFFPGARVMLQAISPKEQAILTRLNRRFETNEAASRIYGQRRDLWSVRHQIGGEPFLIQYLLDLECPHCRAKMPFLASIANDCLDERGMAGDDGVQVLYHYCRSCCMVGAYQTVD